MNKKINIKKTSITSLLIILMFILYPLGLIIGNLISDKYYLYLTLLIINTFVVVFVIINAIIGKIINYKMNNKDFEKTLNEITKKKEKISDTKKKLFQITRSYRNIYFYCIFFYSFLLLILFCNGIAFDPSIVDSEKIIETLYFLSFIYFVIVYLLIGICFITSIINHISEKNKDSKEEYLEVKDFIKNIFIEEGINNNIKINIISQANVGIIRNNKEITISIGVHILKFFTNDEIRSIIYHEIAHYKDEDSVIFEKKAKYKELAEILLSNSVYTFICPYISYIGFNNLILENLINIYYEEKADKYVLGKNCNNDYANASIKLFGIGLISERNLGDIDYLIAKEGKWTKEIIEDYFNNIAKLYNEHLDFFILASKKHLKANFDTHPNVRERVSRFKTTELNPKIENIHTFDDDIFKFYEFINSNYFNDKSKYNFDEYIKDYEKYIDIRDNLESIEEMKFYIEQAMNYGDYEYAKKYALKLLDFNPNDDLTKYILGNIYSMIDFSDECIPYLESLIDNNTKYKSNSINILGQYALMSGKEELREKLKKLLPNAKNNDRYLNKALSLKLGEKLIPFENEEVTNHIIEIVKECEYIKEISIGTKKYKNQIVHHILVFYDLNNKDNNDNFNEVIDKALAYINSLDEIYNIFPIYYKMLSKMHKYRRKPLSKYIINSRLL